MQNILKNCTTNTFTPPRSSPPHCTVLIHPTARYPSFPPVTSEGTPAWEAAWPGSLAPIAQDRELGRSPWLWGGPPVRLQSSRASPSGWGSCRAHPAAAPGPGGQGAGRGTWTKSEEYSSSCFFTSRHLRWCLAYSGELRIGFSL